MLLKFCVICSSLIIFSCAPKSDHSPPPPSENIVAWIDGKPLLKEDVLFEFKVFLNECGVKEPITDTTCRIFFKKFLREKAKNYILDKQAQILGMRPEESTGETLKALETKCRFPPGFEALEQDRRNWIQRASNELFRIQVAAEITQNLSENIEISDDEIENEYSSHISDYTVPCMLKLQIIRVLNRDTANEIHKKLRRGWSFTKLAEQYSTIKTRGAKGEIYWEKITELPEEFSDSLKKQRLKRISPVLQRGNFYYIFKIIARKPERVLPLSAVKDKLHEELLARKRSQRFLKWLEKEINGLDIRMGTPIPPKECYDDALVE